MTVAAKAEEAGVPVYTVALSTASGTIESTSPSGRAVRSPVPQDLQTLARVAEATGGEAFAIENADELDRVYEKLGSQLPTEDRKVEVTGPASSTAPRSG